MTGIINQDAAGPISAWQADFGKNSERAPTHTQIGIYGTLHKELQTNPDLFNLWIDSEAARAARNMSR